MKHVWNSIHEVVQSLLRSCEVYQPTLWGQDWTFSLNFMLPELLLQSIRAPTLHHRGLGLTWTPRHWRRFSAETLKINFTCVCVCVWSLFVAHYFSDWWTNTQTTGGSNESVQASCSRMKNSVLRRVSHCVQTPLYFTVLKYLIFCWCLQWH